MEDIKYSHTPYINEVLFNEILNLASVANFDKAGANSKCAIIKDYAVLENSGIIGHDDTYKNVIESLHNLNEKGVNVAPILGYAVTEIGKPYYNGNRYDKGYVVQQKAEGKELYSPYGGVVKSFDENKQECLDYLKLLESIPQEHYDKWISDYKAITDEKIMVDPSKPSNFFYDAEKGFSFIDLNSLTQEPLFDKLDRNGEQSHAEFVLYSFTPFRPFFNSNFVDEYFSTPEEKEYVTQVTLDSFEKNALALQKVGVTQENIDTCLEMYNVNLPVKEDASPSLEE